MLINWTGSCVDKENDVIDTHSKNWNAMLPNFQSFHIKVVFIITIIIISTGSIITIINIIIFITIVTQ